MYNRILVPHDGGLSAEWALEAAEKLADRWGVGVDVLTLLHAKQRTTDLPSSITKRLTAGNRSPVVEMEIRSVSYTVAEDIAAEFDEIDDTLVVMGTWARGRSAGIIGNVAEEVMRHIRQPMLLVGSSKVSDTWPSGPMVVCTDGSEFAETIGPVASRWAAALDLDVEVVGMIDQAKVPAGVSPALESASVSRLAGAMGQTAGRTVGYDVLHGNDPAEAIVEHARLVKSSIIALATHGRTGIERLALGSTAMSVVRRASCPVLINRPPVDLDL